ncbi:hypothetical protein [Burkholderia sp. BCC0405]|uniref:hypothetical protein n=1 Tax=Burkholderia sp. BCC0405 TaxID=2676298 RepID=UPI0015893D61|nr:hypothetical protein [Burkholderia sp. BCC0405]
MLHNNYQKLHWQFTVFRVERMLSARMKCLNIVRAPDRATALSRRGLMREEMGDFAVDGAFF